jgi:hypothetical protein
VIQHLASAEHVAAVKAFWSEHGADVAKRHLYVLSEEDLEKVGDGGFLKCIPHCSRGIIIVGICFLCFEECVKIWRPYLFIFLVMLMPVERGV